MIQVNLEDHTGNRTRQTKLAESAPISKLIPALVTALSLPATDPAGRSVTYHLSYNGRQIQDDETLTSVGVRNGESISIIPEMTAGSFHLKYSFARPSESADSLVQLCGEARMVRPQKGLPDFAIGWKEPGHVRVCLTKDALAKIEAHARAHLDVEVAGILTGKVFKEKKRFLILIDDIHPANQVVATCVSLQFTSECWLEILKERAARPRAITLGWYHSHPGFGIFLSETDRFTHASFFRNEPWYVALVVDPRSGDCGAFTWEDGQIRQATEVLIV